MEVEVEEATRACSTCYCVRFLLRVWLLLAVCGCFKTWLGEAAAASVVGLFVFVLRWAPRSTRWLIGLAVEL